jgi:anti-sigma B factor antagonist
MSWQPRHWQLEVEQVSHVTVVKILQRRLLDGDTIDWLGGQLFQLADELGERDVVLNLVNVERVSSALVGKLAALHARVNTLGGRLALCQLHPELAAVLKMLRLHRYLNVYDREDDAVQALDRQSVA